MDDHVRFLLQEIPNRLQSLLDIVADERGRPDLNPSRSAIKARVTHLLEDTRKVEKELVKIKGLKWDKAIIDEPREFHNEIMARPVPPDEER